MIFTAPFFAYGFRSFPGDCYGIRFMPEGSARPEFPLVYTIINKLVTVGVPDGDWTGMRSRP
jgi:hypothetical protein